MPIHLGIPKSYGLRVYRSTAREPMDEERKTTPDYEVEIAQDHHGWHEPSWHNTGWSERLTPPPKTAPSQSESSVNSTNPSGGYKSRRQCADLQQATPMWSPNESYSAPATIGSRVAQLKQEASHHRRTTSRDSQTSQAPQTPLTPRTPRTPRTPQTPLTVSEISTPTLLASDAASITLGNFSTSNYDEWHHRPAALAYGPPQNRQVSSVSSSHQRTGSASSWRALSGSGGLRSPMRPAQSTGIYASPSPTESRAETPVHTPVQTPVQAPAVVPAEPRSQGSNYARAISRSLKNKITVARAGSGSPAAQTSRSRLSAINYDREQTPNSICSSNDSLYEDYENSTPQAPRFGLSLSLKPSSNDGSSGSSTAAWSGESAADSISGDDSTLDDDSSSEYNDLEVQLLEGVCEKVQSLKAHIVYYVNGKEITF